MQCPHCLRTIDEGSNFCPHCAGKISEDALSPHALHARLEKGLQELAEANAAISDEIKAMAQDMGKLKTSLQLMGQSQAQAQSQATPQPETRQTPAPTSAQTPPPQTVSSPEEMEFSFDQAAAKAQPDQKHAKTPAPPTPRSPRPSRPKDTQELELKMGQKWLLIAGIIIMVFGVGYFLKYSFDQGWIGPAGRVALAYLWGAVFLAGGEVARRKAYESYGFYLLAGGVAVLYFATWAAYQVYGLFSPGAAFVLMALTTALSIALAIINDTKGLAVIGLLGGFLTPVLLSTGQDHHMFLFSYMTVLNAGILATAFHKRWEGLNSLGCVSTYLLYAGWVFSHYSESKFWPAIIFLNVFFLLYALIPFVYDIRGVARRSRGAFVILPNSFIAFGFGYGMIKEAYSQDHVSILTLLYAAIFLGFASYLMKKGLERSGSFAAMCGNAALFLGLTIPILLSGSWITVFWALQGLVLFWLGCRMGMKVFKAGSTILISLALGKFWLYDYPVLYHMSGLGVEEYGMGVAFSRGYWHRFLPRIVNTVFMLGALVGVARLASVYKARPAEFFSFVRGLAIFFLFAVLNLECMAFFTETHPAARATALSVLWTLFSVGLVVYGFRMHAKKARLAAFALFGLTMFKVFVVDMSNYSTPYRIISFILLGLVLVGTSFLYHRFKDRIQATLAEAPETPQPPPNAPGQAPGKAKEQP